MYHSKHFHFNYGHFLREMSVKVKFMLRDLEVFHEFGYSIEKAKEIENLIRDFGDFPTDEELAGDVMIATEKKNLIRAELIDAIRKIIVRVDIIFDSQNPHYKKFGLGTLSRMTDEALHRTGKRVARVAGMYLSEMKKTGLHKSDLKDLLFLADRFDEAIEKKLDAVADREIATMERTGLANLIYQEILALCNVGKEIWKNRNEAKYNDYILYDTPSTRSNHKEDPQETEMRGN
jgi:hypothetical protein